MFEFFKIKVNFKNSIPFASLKGAEKLLHSTVVCHQLYFTRNMHTIQEQLTDIQE